MQALVFQKPAVFKVEVVEGRIVASIKVKAGKSKT